MQPRHQNSRRHRATTALPGLAWRVWIAAIFLLVPLLVSAQVKRVVIVKVDGLPYGLTDSLVKERDPRTGKSRLPWIDHIFYQRGSRLGNFYVRGMSLSAPSWSTLDTGQHLQVKGNVEFDRYTLHAYDYLNFIPFYLKSAAGARIDMPGAELLDSLGLPMLFDAFAHEDRYISFQLYQRGMRFNTLREAIQKNFLKHPRQLLDEWTLGLDMRSPFFEQMERELVQKLGNPNTRYLDLYISAFDHVAHHNRDRRSHMDTLQDIDRVVGRIWTAIQGSPMADETALIVVSDHGFNTDDRIYSQGYNLVKLLGSPQGGGHHVVTKRRLMLNYSLKGINFLVPLITTTTDDSYYLEGQSTTYPTALLDFDGNERAAIHLRDSDLNLLHILFQQLQRNSLSPTMRSALTDAFFKTIELRRKGWQQEVRELGEELAVLRTRIEQQRKVWEAHPKQFTPQESERGLDDQKKRDFALLEKWTGQELKYSQYANALIALLALRADKWHPSKLKIEAYIPRNTMGERNSLYELQNYIAGIATGGLALNADGSLDLKKSFVRVDYFALFYNVAVWKNVQPAVGSKPIDIVALRIDSDLVASQLKESGLEPAAVWLYGGPDKQALILGRRSSNGELSLRYQPVRNLREDASGRIQFELVDWQAGLPLRIFEDQSLLLPKDERGTWLGAWHRDSEWLQALHKTRYSNGLVGAYEALARHPLVSLDTNEPGISAEERVMRRFLRRQRDLVEPDLQLVAHNHWNFDVRGFNPGGNHGSFFRMSTHSILMFAGGARTGIPHAALIDEPYDTLSFVPTVLALTGNLRDDNQPVPVLWQKGFRRFPGKPVKEVLTKPEQRKIAVTGASVSP
jgi:hypothetical protein